MHEIKKLSENKIMIKIELPIYDINTEKRRKIGSTTLKIRYKKSKDYKYPNKYQPMMNGTKSSPTRGLSQKYGTKISKIHIVFDYENRHEFEEHTFNLPKKVSFQWDDGDRKRWRNKKIELLLKD